jgi:hypothetical protein
MSKTQFGLNFDVRCTQTCSPLQLFKTENLYISTPYGNFTIPALISSQNNNLFLAISTFDQSAPEKIANHMKI